jgi:hypothetical protein
LGFRHGHTIDEKVNVVPCGSGFRLGFRV